MTKRKSVEDAPLQRPGVLPFIPHFWFDHRPWFLALLLVVVTFVAYQPIWHAGFIWDDGLLITDNRMVQAKDGLYRFWFTTEAADYYPLTSSFWWLQWRLWGRNASGYHAVNVVLHAANVVLMWMVLRRLKIPGAWLAALLFAVHPVSVATVAWVSEQKNTLSMLFFALSILCYLRFDEENERYWYGLSLGACLLALLSKSAVVMLPVVLLGCVWWSHGRLRPRDWLRTTPFFALSIVLGLTTVWFQYYRALNGRGVRTGGLFSRLAVAGLAPWFYLYKTVLPLGLCLIYPQWDPRAWGWGGCLPGIALAGSFALLYWKRNSWGRALLFGFGYFVVMLFPVLGFFDQGFYQYSMVADHWQYYSIAGIAALAAAGTVALGPRLRCGRLTVVGPVAGVVVVALGVLSWQRCLVFRDQEALFRDNLRHNPLAWVAHYNLGNILLQEGKVSDAIGHYEQALEIRPDYAEAHNNLGMGLARMGKIEEAIAHYEQSLQINPENAEAHNNLGSAFFQEGKISDAIGRYKQALQSKPDYAEAHCNLGIALAETGEIQEAIGHYEQALSLKPDYAEAHYNLALALIRRGRVPEALAQFEQALRIKPDYADVHYSLGVVLEQAGHVPEAQGHYEQALRINPDYVDAHNNLGNVLLQEGKVSEAIGQYEQALRIKPQCAEAQYNLGLALARLGRVQEAVGHWEQALRIKPDYPEVHYVLGMASEQAGKVPQAIEHYKQALRIKPDFTQAQSALARLQAGQ